MFYDHFFVPIVSCVTVYVIRRGRGQMLNTVTWFALVVSVSMGSQYELTAAHA